MIAQKDLRGDWDAISYFRNLTEKNRLAGEKGFRFGVVSDLQGFADALGDAPFMSAPALVCVSDVSNGALALWPTPHRRQVKTVFMAMRHGIEKDAATQRTECFRTIRELFRQFMSKFAKEKTMLEQGGLKIGEEITFSEIPKYFASGFACAVFQISVTVYENLIERREEWND